MAIGTTLDVFKTSYLDSEANGSRRRALLAAAHADELNAQASEGRLTEEEQAELKAYMDIGDLLAY